VPPRVPRLVATFLLFVPLWGGLPCHHMSLDPWASSFSSFLCGVGSCVAAKSAERREIFFIGQAGRVMVGEEMHRRI
jgi:hypothetical protein